MGLTGAELCTRLQIDAKQLTAWLRQGLPSTGRGKKRRFDAAAVRDWLVAKGKAEPLGDDRSDAPSGEQPIAHTWAQVAEYFSVNQRTVGTWIQQGMPGKSGRRGTREGFFPLFDIEAWREGRKPDHLIPGDETKSQAQARLARARAELLELEVKRQHGQLIDAEEAARRWLRLLSEAKSQLMQLPTQVARALPDGIDAKTRRRARTLTKRSVDRALDVLALLLEQEAESADEEASLEDGSSDG